MFSRARKRIIICNLRITFCVFITLFIVSPIYAGNIDYQQLRETPLETALRKVLSPGVIDWDEEEILSVPEAPAITHKMIWPLKKGRLGTLFNRYRKRGKRVHHGIDIAAPYKTPIHAVLPGTVEIISGGGIGFRGYGKVVIVKHDNNLWTLYSHCSVIRVKVGQKVKQDEVIAFVGRTGRATGNHLHFEVRKEHGYPLDPMKFLPKDSVYYSIISK